MPYRIWLKLTAILVAVLVTVFAAWRADRQDRAQLAAELASTKQLLQAADARQRARDTQVAQTLSALAAQERTAITPAQILRALPKALPLPQPITLQPASATPVGAALGPPAGPSTPASNPLSPATSGSSTANASTSPSNEKRPAGAVIPSADLKPLYDFTLDCQACQAKLSTAQSDLADEKTKTVALTKERDDALRVAKGGSAWRRIARAAKWFLLGAAAGAAVAVAKAPH